MTSIYTTSNAGPNRALGVPSPAAWSRHAVAHAQQPGTNAGRASRHDQGWISTPGSSSPSPPRRGQVINGRDARALLATCSALRLFSASGPP